MQQDSLVVAHDICMYVCMYVCMCIIIAGLDSHMWMYVCLECASSYARPPQNTHRRARAWGACASLTSTRLRGIFCIRSVRVLYVHKTLFLSLSRCEAYFCGVCVCACFMSVTLSFHHNRPTGSLLPPIHPPHLTHARTHARTAGHPLLPQPPRRGDAGGRRPAQGRLDRQADTHVNGWTQDRQTDRQAGRQTDSHPPSQWPHTPHQPPHHPTLPSHPHPHNPHQANPIIPTNHTTHHTTQLPFSQPPHRPLCTTPCRPSTRTNHTPHHTTLINHTGRRPPRPAAGHRPLLPRRGRPGDDEGRGV